MKALCAFFVLALSGAFSIQAVHAACPRLTFPKYDGGKVFVQTFVDGTCDQYATSSPNSSSDSYSSRQSHTHTYGEYDVTSIIDVQASASSSSLRASSSLYKYEHTYPMPFKNTAQAKQTFSFTLDDDDVPFTIPYRECSRYSGHPNPKSGAFSSVTISNQGVLSMIAPRQPLVHDGRFGFQRSICNAGVYTIKTPGTKNIVVTVTTNLTYAGEKEVELTPKLLGKELSGTLSASVDFNVRAPGREKDVTCTSTSGDAAGCEKEIEPDPSRDANSCTQNVAGGGAENGAGGSMIHPAKLNQNVGGPINYFYGYKHKDQTDYVNGILSLMRNYRSDRTWLPSAMGQRWKHNFDRDLEVTTFNGTRNADIIDMSGAIVSFIDTGSGWTPLYSDITASFNDDGSGGYIYTLNNDTKEFYNNNGQLTRIEYQGFEALNLSYNALSGKLESVRNEHNQSLDFTYNAKGTISNIATPTGLLTYEYDSNLNLISVTKPDGKSITYHYDDPKWPYALTSIEDERGKIIGVYTYDPASGKAITTSSPVTINGAPSFSTYAVAYNADDSVTVTNPLAKKTTYHFTTINGIRKLSQVEGHASPNCAAANKSYNYTNEGWIKGATDWEGNVTSYKYDAAKRLEKITEDDGGTQQRDTQITYINAKSHLIQNFEKDKLRIEYTYDDANRITQATYIDTGAEPNISRTHRFSYFDNSNDANGNLVLGKLQTHTDPRGFKTSYTYDNHGFMASMTNEKGHVWQVLARDSSNRITETLDPNGTKDKIDYDVMGRVIQYTQAHNRSVPIKGTSIYTYNEDGALSKTTLANGVYLENFYDQAGRLEKIQNSDSSESYSFDASGNVLEGRRKKITSDPVTYQYFQKFDQLSRLIERHNNTNSVSYTYNDNSDIVTIEDGYDQNVTLTYDGLNRVSQRTDRRGSITNYAYSELDDLLGVEFTASQDSENNAYPLNLKTTYITNAFGEVEREISPDRGETIYDYDANGNVIKRLDATGRDVRYAYDALNRLSAITYPNDTSLNVTLTYDLESECGAGAKGRLCAVTSPSFGTITYVYDDVGRVTQVSKTPFGKTFSMITYYEYDSANYLTAIIYPSGRKVTYSYNNNGEVIAVKSNLNSDQTILANNIAYLAFGPVAGLDYGNGIHETNSYDDAYRLEGREVSGLTNIMDDRYSYDANGNIASTTNKNAITQNLTYTPNDELKQQGSLDYVLDGAGNRLNKSRPSQNIDINYEYEFDAGTNAYTSRINKIFDAGTNSAIGTLILDEAGLTTNYSGQTYIWDEAGRLKEISESGDRIAHYTYDPQNQRFSKTANATTIYYIYSGGTLLGEYDASGTLIREYVYLNNRPLAQIETAQSSEAITYFHTDHLGTPRIGTNANGETVWSWPYLDNAFGDIPPSGTRTVNLRMPGQYFDAESNLFYNWNRYYDPNTGRYISSDPIGLAAGINTFAYTMANPARYIDPEGLDICRGGRYCGPAEKGWEILVEPYYECIANRSLAWCGFAIVDTALLCMTLGTSKSVTVTGRGLLGEALKSVGEEGAESALKRAGRNIDDLSNSMSGVTKKVETKHTINSGGKHPKNSDPNSIIESQRADGSRSVTYYDDKGRAFSREDYGQLRTHGQLGRASDGRSVPHEHRTDFSDRGPIGKRYRELDGNGKPAGPWINE